MYKYQSRQISVTDFGMPLGMKLDPDNRWVKKAETIPWDAIEERYAALFKNRKGNVVKSLQLALGALLIQTQYQYSDVEVTLQIRETPCLQFFCGMKAYEDKMPFDPSLMVYFRKRLTPEILGEINEMIIAKATAKPEPDSEDPTDNPPDDSNDPPNEGTLITDSTCTPQDVQYPQDTSLLNEARENLEEMVDELHDPADGVKPRTYRKKARKDYLKTAKKRKKSSKDIRKAVKKQLGYVRRDIDIVDTLLKAGKTLSNRHLERFSTIKTAYEQQLFMYENRTHTVDNRIVSLSQPWFRPIVRGKAKAKCEFGAKLDISVVNGFARLEYCSFDAYNEGDNLIEIIERYREREGHYPECVLADEIYRNRKNLVFCKEKGIRLLGKPLGRPKKDAAADKKQIRQDEIDRIEVERKFSLAKGSYGMGLIRTRVEETSKTVIALSILAMNIAQLGRILRAIFWRLGWMGNVAFVQ